MADLIDRQALLERITATVCKYCDGSKLCKDCELDDAIFIINMQATVEPQKAQWVKKHHRKEIPDMHMMITGEYPTCSLCGFAEIGLSQNTNYCPACGADMRGDNPDE